MAFIFSQSQEFPESRAILARVAISDKYFLATINNEPLEPPEECLLIDDRPLNLDCARQLGMRTVHFHNAAQLRQELAANGVSEAGG